MSAQDVTINEAMDLENIYREGCKLDTTLLFLRTVLVGDPQNCDDLNLDEVSREGLGYILGDFHSRLSGILESLDRLKRLTATSPEASSLPKPQIKLIR